MRQDPKDFGISQTESEAAWSAAVCRAGSDSDREDEEEVSLSDSSAARVLSRVVSSLLWEGILSPPPPPPSMARQDSRHSSIVSKLLALPA